MNKWMIKLKCFLFGHKWKSEQEKIYYLDEYENKETEFYANNLWCTRCGKFDIEWSENPFNSKITIITTMKIIKETNKNDNACYTTRVEKISREVNKNNELTR